jgi:hypothetical protein
MKGQLKVVSNREIGLKNKMKGTFMENNPLVATTIF